MGEQPRPSFLLPLFTNVVGGEFSEVQKA
jgi:hypothetical protein